MAERWRSERWDLLRFQFPNWAMRLPDFSAMPAMIRMGSRRATRWFVSSRIMRISSARRCEPGSRCGRCIDRRTGTVSGWIELATTVEARNVVIATGPYQRPAIPAAAKGLGEMLQISRQRLSQSGAVARRGRAGGRGGCVGMPDCRGTAARRTARGSVGGPASAGAAALSRAGLHLVDMRRWGWMTRLWIAGGAAGAVADQWRGWRAYRSTCAPSPHPGWCWPGRLQAAHEGVVAFAPDLAANLAGGDESYAGFIRMADAHVAQAGLALPVDPECLPAFPKPVVYGVEALDLRAAGITAVIWATGYHYDFGWIDLDMFGPTGQPVHRRGVTGVPGAYFPGAAVPAQDKVVVSVRGRRGCAYLRNLADQCDQDARTSLL